MPDPWLLGWWSQTGSNRRPHACKARALPTELWPLSEHRGQKSGIGNSDTRILYSVLRVVGPERVERSTSRLSGVRSNHLSYEPDEVFSMCSVLKPAQHHLAHEFGSCAAEKEGKRRRRQDGVV